MLVSALAWCSAAIQIFLHFTLSLSLNPLPKFQVFSCFSLFSGFTGGQLPRNGRWAAVRGEVKFLKTCMSKKIFIFSPYLIICLNKLPMYVILCRKEFPPGVLKALLHCCSSKDHAFLILHPLYVTFFVCSFVFWEYFYPPGSEFPVTCLGMDLCSSIQATSVWTFISFSSGLFSPLFSPFFP